MPNLPPKDDLVKVGDSVYCKAKNECGEEGCEKIKKMSNIVDLNTMQKTKLK